MSRLSLEIQENYRHWLHSINYTWCLQN